MPRNITVTFDDGSTHVYQNAPDDVTPEQVQARASQEFGKTIRSLNGGRPANQAAKPVQQPTFREMLKRELYTSVPGAFLRGVKDIVDTGAGLLSNLGGADEAARVRAMNEAGKQDFAQATEGSIVAPIARVAGQVAGTTPLVRGVGAVVGKVAPALGQSIQTGGMATGLKPVGTAGKIGDMATRVAGGAVSGGLAAGAVNPEDADTGAAIGAALPGVVKVAGAAGRAMRGAPADPSKMAIARAASQEGYIVPPEDLGGGALTKAASGLSGKLKTAQEASAKNQAITNSLARRAVGVGANDVLDINALENVRRSAQPAYEAMRSLGQVKADKQYLSALDSVNSQFQGAAKSFPGLKRNEVSELIDTMRKDAFDSGDAVDAIKVLRENADKAFRSGDTGLGKAFRKVSDALEGVIERHGEAIGQPEVVKAFRDARQLVAKTYSVQRSLANNAGDVSANKLATLLKQNKPLTGELRQIAEFSDAFPQATQALKETPKTLSPLDFGAAAMGLAGSGGNPLAALGLVARPAARSVLLSRPVQAAMMREGRNPLAALMNNQLTEQLAYRVAPVIAAD